jgi:hypothetical protein
MTDFLIDLSGIDIHLKIINNDPQGGKKNENILQDNRGVCGTGFHRSVC